MTLVRWAWGGLTVCTVLFGFFVAAQSMLQITSCEIDLLPEVPTREKCEESIADYFGTAVVGMLAVPVLICVLPAVAPLRPVAWTAAWTMAAVVILGMTRGLTGNYHYAVYVFYLPVALVAIGLAAAHGPLTCRRTTGVR